MRVFIASAALALSGCHSECLSLQGSPGVSFRVIDHVTRQSLHDQAAVTVTRETPPRETRTGTLIGPSYSMTPLEITTHRAGSYRITVHVPGYQEWSYAVYVPDVTDACTYEEPAGVSLTAEMQRL